MTSIFDQSTYKFSQSDLVMSNGYNTYTNLADYIRDTLTTSGTIDMKPVITTVTKTETIWVPPTPYIPGTPGAEATETTISFTNNLGWDTWARSLSSLVKGSVFNFSCPSGSSGICLGLGSSQEEGQSIGLFSHALLVTRTGIKVYENGVVIDTLKSSYNCDTSIRLFYAEDGSVSYVVSSGSDTTIIKSSTQYHKFDAYLYGYLYSSEGEISTAALKEGTIQYGSM